MGAFPFLRNLAAREELVRNGKLSTIIFIRDKNVKGQEISGYIDYGHRLKEDHFEAFFERKKRLLPRPTEQGLLFKNKRDRKVINVDPKGEPGDNSKRSDIKTNEYIQVVIFDHMTRKKS